MTTIQIVVVSLLVLLVAMVGFLILMVAQHKRWRGRADAYDANDGSEDW